MESRTTEKFSISFENLPAKIKEDAKRSFKLWKSNPYRKNLRFKNIHGTLNIYSVRIGSSYKVLGVKEENTVIWFWIGSHGDYDNLLKSL